MRSMTKIQVLHGPLRCGVSAPGASPAALCPLTEHNTPAKRTATRTRERITVSDDGQPDVHPASVEERDYIGLAKFGKAVATADQSNSI